MKTPFGAFFRLYIDTQRGRVLSVLIRSALPVSVLEGFLPLVQIKDLARNDIPDRH